MLLTESCVGAAGAEVLALRFMFPVVGCKVLYVLRLAGGPAGKILVLFWLSELLLLPLCPCLNQEM